MKTLWHWLTVNRVNIFALLSIFFLIGTFTAQIIAQTELKYSQERYDLVIFATFLLSTSYIFTMLYYVLKERKK